MNSTDGGSCYREYCYWPRWFYALLILPTFVLPLVAFFAVDHAERWPVLIAFPIFLVMLVWFGRMEVRVDDGGFSYGFWRASNLVPWSRVRSVEPAGYRFSQYWGWG